MAGRWALVTIAMVSIAGRAVPAAACAGDCDGNGAVAIHELVTLVNVALERVGVERCSAGDLDRDGDVSVDEVVSGVNVALDGCLGSAPTPTATPGSSSLFQAIGIGADWGAHWSASSTAIDPRDNQDDAAFPPEICLIANAGFQSVRLYGEPVQTWMAVVEGVQAYNNGSLTCVAGHSGPPSKPLSVVYQVAICGPDPWSLPWNGAVTPQSIDSVTCRPVPGQMPPTMFVQSLQAEILKLKQVLRYAGPAFADTVKLALVGNEILFSKGTCTVGGAACSDERRLRVGIVRDRALLLGHAGGCAGAGDHVHAAVGLRSGRRSERPVHGRHQRPGVGVRVRSGAAGAQRRARRGERAADQHLAAGGRHDRHDARTARRDGAGAVVAPAARRRAAREDHRGERVSRSVGPGARRRVGAAVSVVHRGEQRRERHGARCEHLSGRRQRLSESGHQHARPQHRHRRPPADAVLPRLPGDVRRDRVAHRTARAPSTTTAASRRRATRRPRRRRICSRSTRTRRRSRFRCSCSSSSTRRPRPAPLPAARRRRKRTTACSPTTASSSRTSRRCCRRART